MNSDIIYVDISGDSSSKETSPALFQKHGKRKADNKENLPPTSPSLIQTKRSKSNKLEFSNEIESVKHNSEALPCFNTNELRVNAEPVEIVDDSYILTDEEADSHLNETDDNNKQQQQQQENIVNLPLNKSFEIKPFILDTFQTATNNSETLLVIAQKDSIEYNNETEVIIISETTATTTTTDNNNNNVWKQNLELISLRRDSLVSETPTKLSLNDVHTRVYHQFEQTETEQSEYSSPLEVKNDDNNNNNNNEPEKVLVPETETVMPSTSKEEEAVAAEEEEEEETVVVAAAATTSEKKESKKGSSPSQSVESVLNYAVSLIENKLSANEIKTGIFGDDKNQTKSKTQSPFLAEKTNDFKNSIAKHFQFSNTKMESMWKIIRPKLNVKLANRRRYVK